MNQITDFKQISSDLADRTLALNLSLCEKGNTTLRSCEVLGQSFRNRVSFTANHRIEDVLVARLSQAIQSCLNNLPRGAHILSLPDFLVELPGLTLSGARILVMKCNEGVRNAIFRFKEFMGTLNSAFQMDVGFHEPRSNHGEKLAVNVLSDVCLPILNLCRSFEELNFGSHRQNALEVLDRAREFEFQTELLKRFIFNAGMAQAKAPILGSLCDLHVQIPQIDR